MQRRWLIGIDEAGRGPFAGPVTLAVCVIPRRGARRRFDGIRDSKKLSAPGREKWFRRLKSDSDVFFCSTSVGPRSIDRFGIMGAIRQGLARLLKTATMRHIGLRQVGHEEVLLDGSLFAPPAYCQKTIIKGDEKIPVIAAASIVAKVRRDRYMVRLARAFPQYGFEIHKGYGTQLHRDRICQFGLSKVHRKTFCARYT